MDRDQELTERSRSAGQLRPSPPPDLPWWRVKVGDVTLIDQ
ncbi:hypothetical protein OG830_20575 [Streptomyces sp. NBC_00121]|nr:MULTISPECIES: hypothetical protein [unclassified Streptomyces]WNO66101.1 hypothetical protein RPQ02_21020 [Streptomyces sp. AM2-3-1]WSC70631.1 hypothetical protein OG807_20485 [Streptomyces sp. NBC_01760]WTI88521.1 hypothetical protein OHB17_21235 [Streptomyces sp. NBC_00724]